MNNSGAASGAVQPTSQPNQDVTHGAGVQAVMDSPQPYQARQPSDSVDEVVQMLKTAFPLLILSMETFVDNIGQRFKPTSEEETYRYVCMLLQDAIQVRSHCKCPLDFFPDVGCRVELRHEDAQC
jgi:transformation/transcription domain-associated protein